MRLCLVVTAGLMVVVPGLGHGAAKRLSLAARHQPPTVHAAEPLVLVDRGRAVYAGRDAVRSPLPR